MTTIHRFADTADAYDACQSDDAIHHGDVLATPAAVAVLDRAWPIAVTQAETAGTFHTLAVTGTAVEDMYAAQDAAARDALRAGIRAARELARSEGLPLAFWVEAAGPAPTVTYADLEAMFGARSEQPATDPDLIPTRINGYRVTDAVRASSLDSNIVHVIAQDDRERVVWDCYRDDDGVWQAQNGAYGKARSWALGVLVGRLGWGRRAEGVVTYTVTEEPRS